MIALLLAAQMAAAQPLLSPLQAAPAPSCANARGVALIDYPNSGPVADKPPARRLGDLPKAHMEYAVERKIDGCVKPVIVRYDVEQQPVTRAGALSNRR